MTEWCPFAIRRDGPASKQGYGSNTAGLKRGEIKHSAVGSLSGALAVLDRPDIRSSWHFTIAYSGDILQHYALSTHCWHGNDTDGDGGVAANFDLIGIEHEGGGPGNESEPLTPGQVTATVRLTRWAAEQFGFADFARYPHQTGVWTLVEHKEVGNTPTACPSDRIPWELVLSLLSLPGSPTEPPPSFPPAEVAQALMRSYNAWFDGQPVHPWDAERLHWFDKQVP